MHGREARIATSTTRMGCLPPRSAPTIGQAQAPGSGERKRSSAKRTQGLLSVLGSLVMNGRPDAPRRPTRFAGTFALGLVLSCVVPVFLWPRTNHSNGVQASSRGSRAHPPADTAGWSPSKLGEPLLRDPVWVYNNWSSYDEQRQDAALLLELFERASDCHL